MRYLDVCSGISAPTQAWKPLGWEAACFAEIEAAPRAVLAHHYPDVPLRGDFTKIEGTEYGPVDLLVGGTPCQSFSIAGLRGGLGDDRGNLALEFARLADRARPRWLVWENVPGVLSVDEGRAFGSILGAMAELGYGTAYRVLDAQHFGVPQRRRRVFVVGYLGDWRRAAAVLFERHSLSGNPAPRREAGQGTSEWPAQCAPTLNAAFGDKQGLEDQHALNGAGMFVTHALRGEGFDVSEDGTGRGTPLVPVAIQERAVSENVEAGPQGKGWQEGCAYTLEARNKVQAVAFSENQQGEVWEHGALQALNKGGGKPGQSYPAIRQASSVRRLTPRECERLQGFPDDFTLVPYRGRMTADGPRYKMLGNSMAVPVLRWIGERIEMVEGLSHRTTSTEAA